MIVMDFRSIFSHIHVIVHGVQCWCPYELVHKPDGKEFMEGLMLHKLSMHIMIMVWLFPSPYGYIELICALAHAKNTCQFCTCSSPSTMKCITAWQSKQNNDTIAWNHLRWMIQS